ncbi:hypothetical protein M977_04656 [Buttiauxella gaviniae ATCC 51604]|uniref:Uncharacterized protein n=1 Tax=Buttiauxella gaviniae ATCC 51604 TaxID=1354253 RepID=A0A1B7HK98_9ENTR|nr:hypothetical protein M977_04656 [Buttiauxella gaviniae ATCC 51604]
MTAFDAVIAIEYFCSLILTKPENLVLKSALPKWLSTALTFGIPQEYLKAASILLLAL